MDPAPDWVRGWLELPCFIFYCKECLELLWLWTSATYRSSPLATFNVARISAELSGYVIYLPRMSYTTSGTQEGIKDV